MAEFISASGRGQAPTLLEQSQEIAIPSVHNNKAAVAEFISASGRGQAPTLLEQSQEIATPSVHNDKEAILSMQASSPEGHSTIFYCKKYKWVIPMNLAG